MVICPSFYQKRSYFSGQGAKRLSGVDFIGQLVWLPVVDVHSPVGLGHVGEDIGPDLQRSDQARTGDHQNNPGSVHPRMLLCSG